MFAGLMKTYRARAKQRRALIYLRLLDVAHKVGRFRDVLTEYDQAVRLNSELEKEYIVQLFRGKAFASLSDFRDTVSCFETIERQSDETHKGTGLTYDFYWVLGNALRECPASVGNGEKRSSVKIAERTYEKRAQALHC
jgi:hypothetical protein